MSPSRKREEKPVDLVRPPKEHILFRKEIPEIPSTTYGTFSVFKYPAKFIPQIVAFVLKKYAEKGMKIFDPFAGHGVTGLVSRVYGFDYELWDLNPLLETIHDSAINTRDHLDLPEILQEIRQSEKVFLPRWSNLGYWFPEQFLPTLSRFWGYIHSIRDEKIKQLLLIPMLKVTRYFSWSDEKIHKLYKSKFSKQKVEKLLGEDYEKGIYTRFERAVLSLLGKIREYKQMKPEKVKYRIRTGIDSLTEKLDDPVDLLVTSPPYLQAQEYIRSTKLELFWLGEEEDYIRELSRKEIPYRKVPKIDVHSETFEEYRSQIREEHLRSLYDSYFHSILKIFSSLSEKVTKYLCIFVGPAKVRNLSVPIDDIVSEHLSHLGWKHEITYIDRIVSRVMFRSKVNPATGLKDSRMKTEHLLVMKRTNR